MLNNLVEVGENPPCDNYDYMVNYLTRDDVKEALHISPKALPWTPCSPEVNQNYHTEYSSMHDIVKDLLDSGKRGLIYNGDVDGKEK